MTTRSRTCGCVGGTVCVKCNDDKILSVTNIEDLGVFNA